MTNDQTVNDCPCDWSDLGNDQYEVRFLSDSSAARLGLKCGDMVTLGYCDSERRGKVWRLVITEGHGR